MDKWISVRDKLPDDDAGCLVVVNGKHGNIEFIDAIEIGEYFGEEGWFLPTYPRIENPNITYWMPLPDAPEKGA